MLTKARSFFDRFPKWSCFIAGCISAFAMAPTYVLPLFLVGFSVFLLIFSSAQTGRKGGIYTFLYGMGFFTFGLYWVANALLMKIEDYWWLIGFSIFGLPMLLSICWFVAGFITVRISKPDTLARTVLILAALALAEYGRAFNLTGFPWNKFGYMWGFSLPMMQLASLGGVYFVTIMTMVWGATPVMTMQAAGHKKIRNGILAFTAITLAASYGYGALRLQHNPTQMRDDYAVAIIQPNIDQDEKWQAGKELEHFLHHVEIGKEALSEADKTLGQYKSVAMIWPETSLDERLVLSVPEAPKALIDAMQGHAFKTTLISGMWREQGVSKKTGRPNFFNSVAAISLVQNKLNLDTLYDKHHLVPFGEFLPMEQLLDLTPVVGFAGFGWGEGPKVLQSPVFAPFSVMICFEAIWPWYAESHGADWIVNTSNDGWYGDTPGPYQHLVMTRFRAVEQGKPIARAATTGISALIDPFGRVVKKLPYFTQGSIVSPLPKQATDITLYSIFGEGLFFVLIAVGAGIFAILRQKQI